MVFGVRPATDPTKTKAPALRAGGFTQTRYQVAHGQFVLDSNIARMAQLGVNADISPFIRVFGPTSEAIEVFALGEAVSMGLEAECGSLSEGRPADFIILDRNPFASASTDLAATGVVETWFAGKRVYTGEQNDSEAAVHASWSTGRAEKSRNYTERGSVNLQGRG